MMMPPKTQSLSLLGSISDHSAAWSLCLSPQLHQCQEQSRAEPLINQPVQCSIRVTKSENFPDTKIFVAKTFRIKRVNRANFQIRDKCAWFCKILCISMVQICSIGSAYNRCPKFGTFRIVRKFSRSPQHISRSSGLFLDYMDTFSRLFGHCLDHTETFQIIHTLFRLSGHII